MGFQQATATSISLGIDYLLAISSKGCLVQDAKQQSLISSTIAYCHSGQHSVSLVDSWIDIEDKDYTKA